MILSSANRIKHRPWLRRSQAWKPTNGSPPSATPDMSWFFLLHHNYCCCARWVMLLRIILLGKRRSRRRRRRSILLLGLGRDRGQLTCLVDMLLVPRVLLVLLRMILAAVQLLILGSLIRRLLLVGSLSRRGAVLRRVLAQRRLVFPSLLGLNGLLLHHHGSSLFRLGLHLIRVAGGRGASNGEAALLSSAQEHDERVDKCSNKQKPGCPKRQSDVY